MGSYRKGLLSPDVCIKPGLVDSAVPVRVQALVAELPVQRLDEGVLCRATRIDKVDLHFVKLGSQSQGLTSKLRAVVQNKGPYFSRPGYAMLCVALTC
jgi:hypothetical protein